jgi:hypothetical protein
VGGRQRFGFDLRILALTVAHFQATGFAAALIASLSLRAGEVGAQMAAACIPAGLAIVFGGFFATARGRGGGTVVVTLGLWRSPGRRYVARRWRWTG